MNVNVFVSEQLLSATPIKIDEIPQILNYLLSWSELFLLAWWSQRETPAQRGSSRCYWSTVNKYNISLVNLLMSHLCEQMIHELMFRMTSCHFFHLQSECLQVPMDSWGRPFPGWPDGAWAGAEGCWCRSPAGSPCPTGWPWWRRSSRWRGTLLRTTQASRPTAGRAEGRCERQHPEQICKCLSVTLVAHRLCSRTANPMAFIRSHPYPGELSLGRCWVSMSAHQWQGAITYLEPGDDGRAVPRGEGKPLATRLL